MSSKTMLRKCVAVASAGLIAAGMLGVSSLLVGAAPPENLLSGFTLSSSDTEKYQVDSATNSITVNDAAEHTVPLPHSGGRLSKRPVAVPVAGDESGAPEHRLLEQQ